MLTEPQAKLLRWILEQAGGAIHYEKMLGNGDSVTPARPAPDQRGEEFPMDAIDLRELEAQDLLRNPSGNLYEVTNKARMVYEEMTTAPPERPPIGFAPD